MTARIRRALLAAAALALALCAGGAPFASAQSDVIHVGISPFEAHADAYYAQDLGLFKKAGLNVDIQQYAGGSLIVAAIVGGALQIGAGNPLPLVNARQHGIHVVLISPGYISDAANPPIDGLVVAAGSPIHDGKDLSGKTVGVTALRSIDQIATDLWIDHHGGDSSAVRLVEVPQSAMAGAVAEGRIDAAMVGEPALSAGIASGNVRLLGRAYDAIAPHFIVAAWFATEDWANRNPETVRAFAAAINAASAWAFAHPEQAAAILQKYMKVTFTSAHEYHARTLDPALIQPVIDGALRYKILDTPMDARDLIWKN
jgi:NitT/TauT family transport system substrate-binding protein